MIRKLKLAEVKLASDLADSVYPHELFESLKTFENKFIFFPDCFLGLFINGKLEGYIVGHPWKGEELVPLNYKFGNNSEEYDCFYLHDIVVSPNYRRKGYGAKLTKAILDIGQKKGFNKFLLVAVNDKSRKMCEKFGFRVIKKVEYAPNVQGFKMIKQTPVTTFL